MIPEYGNFFLALALSLAAVQCVVPLVGAARRDAVWMRVAAPAAWLQFAAVAAAFAALTYAFVTNDFSVRYVASNSNTDLPLVYRVAAVWGAHEGSLVLWLLIQALWTVAVVAAGRRLPLEISSRVVGVLGFVSVGFLLFTLFTSNPFLRLQPGPQQGADLNPLLQDPGLAVHPPILYVGYVGFSVAFAFAIAAMLAGRLDRDWARWTRPWTTLAWVFLTIGIALGSWWAYYELGWGGWWFWDPVENASFMPWLVGTALIHSLAVTERRGLFKSWTLLLAISAFSLSLLGTFLVRSGVLNSVHSFASDPTRGFAILLFLAVVVGGALVLYAWRAPDLDSQAGFKLISRETALLMNNVLLVIAALLILYGTLTPLFYQWMDWPQPSIGAPWFELVFILPMLPLVLLIGVGMYASWKTTPEGRLRALLVKPAVLAAILGVAIPWVFFERPAPLTIIATTAGAWVLLASLVVPLRAVFGKQRVGSVAAWGMHVAHVGVGVFTLGATMVSAFSIETDQAIRVGESVTVAGTEFKLRDLRPVAGPNYDAQEGEFEIRRNGRLVGLVSPQKRTYRVQKNPMTEAGIDASLARDWFVALGEPLGAGAWSVRIQYKPMLRWVWLGAVIMAIGGLIAIGDPRYRRRRVTSEAPEIEPAVSKPLATPPSEAPA
ncbi:MAG: heme lyase CcmF/NrfE family subunit [Pseudomonadota bacterium]